MMPFRKCFLTHSIKIRLPKDRRAKAEIYFVWQKAKFYDGQIFFAKKSISQNPPVQFQNWQTFMSYLSGSKAIQT